jgi:ElaB/YqjD/DUF883 family membrane-anchored ribosome-binding protein
MQMTKSSESHTDVSEDTKERFSADFDMLKSSFVQLRQDVHKLLGDALGAGKSSAEMIKDGAAGAVGHLKDRIGDGKERVHDSVEKFGQKIEERPLMSVAIAAGIGFLVATLLHSRR